MNEGKIRERICDAVDQYCEWCGVEDVPDLAQRVLNASRRGYARRAEGGTRMKRKLSLALALLMAALLLGVTALAAGIVMSAMTSRVAQMDAAGQLTTWGLAEKQAFVLAMRQSGYDMDEGDWAMLTDESLPAADREAAADRIVYARYGAVQEEANARRPMPAASVMGEAPDAVQIFRERYLAEHPEATHYDYLDALGYWLRDEYMPQYRAAQPGQADAAAEDGGLTREMAEESLRGHLTEVFNWSAPVVEQACITSEQDAEGGAWHVTATVEAASLQAALGQRMDDATLENEMITLAEGRYTVTYWVARTDAGGWRRAASREALLAEVAEANRMDALHTICIGEAETLAVQAIAAKYGLSDAQISRYFVYDGDTYWNDPACIRAAVLLCTRNHSGAPWDYAAIVNLTTAQVDDVLAAGDLPARAAMLAGKWDQLQANDEWMHYYRFFTTWNPYGWYTDMPEEEWRAVCEAFREVVGTHLQPGRYDPLEIFVLKE